ncbi:ribose utilization transcriptional repressor RbsR [Lactiplantibacillus fabifermentans]|uniref:Ribose operon repressor n=2 Tax=Lactiplantibacillus fabifermentans TaxID=483011 RepID=A0A0R2NRR4_9LACO|nr:LacI family DNA-binding transcriptional regulator [Lactiplantibacillus fabifermentans]ETY74801.1 LacI family transcription regulator [Lactiplantibacillus fabifermentans T30PCM01]KRO26701.1 ribose operon repressor [Lactiplantibacillus fabifermentans DSM 21115]
MANKKVTIKDVARVAGVSITTVSQILNGTGGRFSDATVAKVKNAKAELHYEADYFARRMIVKKSKTIGVLVPDITNPFFSELVRGVENILYQKKFITMLCNADLDTAKEQAYLTELSHRGVDGFIIASSAIPNEAIDEIWQQQQQPLVVLDQKQAAGMSDAVTSDDRTGGQLAAQHLKDLGHQQIAVLMPAQATENIQARLAGIQKVYDPAAITVIPTELSKSAGKAAAPALIASPATAAITVSDEIAFGLYRGLAVAGKRVPADYSIVGYDNVEMSQYVSPQLTTVAQPIFELGQTTAKLLLARIENPTTPWVERQLPVKLMLRNSTARLN